VVKALNPNPQTLHPKVVKALKDEKVPQQARNHYAVEQGLDTLIWQVIHENHPSSQKGTEP